MQTVTESIDIATLHNMSARMFGKLVKAVVDLERGIMVVDADMHADQELSLLEDGSEQGNLWGINLIPDKWGTDEFVVFDSMINLRPSWGNKTRGVDSPHTQAKIKELVYRLVKA